MMPNAQQFRSAFNGFNRQDVVQYIEYMTNKHKAQLEQLNTQLQNARQELAQVAPAQDQQLKEQLDAALARCAALEAQLAESGTPVAASSTSDELEAYRRAERTERLAQERAAQIYAQANAVLADASSKLDAAVSGMTGFMDEVSQKLSASKQELQSAVDAMYAIRPESE